MEQIIQITLIPLVLLMVQAIKNLAPGAERYSITIVLVVGTLLSSVLVDWTAGWQPAMLDLLTFTVLIASGASGVYSWGKKETTIEIPDYSDES